MTPSTRMPYSQYYEKWYWDSLKSAQYCEQKKRITGPFSVQTYLISASKYREILDTHNYWN